MGMESFYINIILCKDCECNLSDFAVIYTEITDSQKSVVISYSFLSFFDSLCQIYSFIKKNEEKIVEIESLHEDITNSIDSFMEFFAKIYSVWKNKLNAFHSDYGFLLVGSGSDFFKIRRKLKKFIFKAKDSQ